MVAVYSASESRQYSAPIVRDGEHPPTLGEFELVGSTAHDMSRIEGAMVDPLIAALKRVG